jgi:hypothetical protein
MVNPRIMNLGPLNDKGEYSFALVGSADRLSCYILVIQEYTHTTHRTVGLYGPRHT